MKKFLFLLPGLIFLYSCSKEPLSDIPLKEHPRPDFERSAWQNLNGYWHFAADSAAAGEKENWQDNPGSFASKILVPFSWASPLSGISMPEINIGWYARRFTIGGQEWKGKNIFIHLWESGFHYKWC